MNITPKLAPNAFDKNYPTLRQMMAGSSFDMDVKNASSLHPQEFKDSLTAKQFILNDLMSLLAGAIISEWSDVNAMELEENLSIITKAIGFENIRRAFYRKLLIKGHDALEDTLYEIAVTAKACSVLDAGSIELEKPIPNSKRAAKQLKNSDIFGKFEGQPVRIEVTVLHEQPVDSVDIDSVQFVENANVRLGFTVEMRSAISDQPKATRARALIELLEKHHRTSGGSSTQIEGLYFEWQEGRYASKQGPIKTVRFYDLDDSLDSSPIREIIFLGQTRRITPESFQLDHPNPPGAFDLSDVPGELTRDPISKKIRDMIEKKIDQCESEVINIIAFGTPSEFHDSELVNALFGAPYVSVLRFQDKNGNYRMGDGIPGRVKKAPFNRYAKFLPDHDQETFVEPFRKISAVLHVRVGNCPNLKMLLNPYAHTPIPISLASRLTDSEPPRGEA